MSKFAVETKNRQVLEAAKATLESSSLHAIPNMIRNKFVSIKLIWIMCYLLSACLCSWFIVDIMTKYYEREVVTRINVKKETRLEFPIVYVCSRLNSTLLEDRIISAKFDLKELKLDQEFQKVALGNWFCFCFNSVQNMKYVNERPGLAILELDLYFGSDSHMIGSFFNGFSIRLADHTQSTASRLDHIFLSIGSFNKIYAHKTVVKKQPFPYSDCIANLNSKVFIFDYIF
jgi:hypothetical protein